MRDIQVLPDQLVNQIAAGEVVERPASVVKELVENSLDAGATHISVEIESGGKTQIRVLDNGSGMTPAAAEVALQRHATSKLRAVEDLFALQTFGFRGEALPSIAAVSRMTLTTRCRGEHTTAIRLTIEGGRILSREEVGAPIGTCIDIRDLLFNVPARQKFLKGEATETAHIADVMGKLALANPSVHVRLSNQSRSTLNAPGHLTYADRVSAVMGSKLGKAAVTVQGTYGGVQVQAFLGAPEQAQSTTRGLQIFVGRRAIRDRGILHAIIQGYDELIPKGRYPAAVIRLDVTPADVDVNVHPQKLEVRFSDPQLVFAAVRQVVRNGVTEAGWRDAVPGHVPFSPRLGAVRQIQEQEPMFAKPASELAVNYAREHAKRLQPFGREKRNETREDPLVQARRETRSKAGTRPNEQPAGKTEPSAAPVQRPAKHHATTKTNPPEIAPTDPDEPKAAVFFGKLQVLGLWDHSYLLCQHGADLVILDQSEVCRRVEYGKRLAQFQAGGLPMQPLLLPQSVELSVEQAQVAKAQAELLLTLGFGLEPFGDGQSFALKGIPADLPVDSPSQVLTEVLNAMAKVPAAAQASTALGVIAGTASNRDIELTSTQIQSLLAALDDTSHQQASTKSLMTTLSRSEIARRIKRGE